MAAHDIHAGHGHGHHDHHGHDDHHHDAGPHSTFSGDRKSTRLNSSHGYISYAVFCLKKKKLALSVRKVVDHFQLEADMLATLIALLRAPQIAMDLSIPDPTPRGYSSDQRRYL